MLEKSLSKLLIFAQEGIIQYFDPKTNLFSFKVTDAGNKKEEKKLLLTHSLISLLGIANYRRNIRIDYEKSLEVILRVMEAERNVRENALLLWLLAKEEDDRAEKIFKKIRLLSNGNFANVETMEISWLVTSLAFEFKRTKDKIVKEALLKFSEILKSRFIADSSIFLHSSSKSNLRYNIANFADQIYSIYALSVFTRVTSEDRYLDMAKKCANKICLLQGELGQWWWHYNALNGDVVQKYPVFCVHQDSMAPFALMALTEVTGLDFSSNISRGLNWIFGENELGINMINERRNFVKRGIERIAVISKMQKISLLILNVMANKGVCDRFDKPKYLRVMNWEYSYHLGWILYAFNEKNRDLWSRF